jgi:GNAT superfamily N-acetyltransferase
MRCVLDKPRTPTIVLIELIRTREEAQNLGAASILLNTILQICSLLGSDVFVTSTEETVKFWKRFGFVKDKNDDLDDEWNEFEDCILMRLPTNNSPMYSTELESDEYLYSDDDYIYFNDTLNEQ